MQINGDELLPECQQMVPEDIERMHLQRNERVFLERFHIVDKPVRRKYDLLRTHLHHVVDRWLNI